VYRDRRHELRDERTGIGQVYTSCFTRVVARPEFNDFANLRRTFAHREQKKPAWGNTLTWVSPHAGILRDEPPDRRGLSFI